MKKLKNLKSLFWMLFIAAFIGLASSIPNTYIQAVDATLTRYFIWENDSNRNAATADSLIGFVNGSDTGTMIPMPSGLVNYWEQSNDSLFPATAGDNTFLLDSVYFSGLPYKDCDSIIGWDNDTLFRMKAPSGGSAFWSQSNDSLFPATATDNLFALDSVYFTGLPYKDCDSILGILNDTIFRMEAPWLTDPMTTIGDILHRNGSNVTARLGIGTSTHVLTSNGTVPYWAAASGGGDTSYFDLVHKTISPKTDVDTVNFESEVLYTEGNQIYFDPHQPLGVVLGLNAASINSSHGAYNIAIGTNAIDALTASSVSNIGIGRDVMKVITTADDNVVIGYQAGDAIGSSGKNVFIGSGAGSVNAASTYPSNVGIGYRSMFGSIGGYCTSVGSFSMYGNTGAYNTGLGSYSLYIGDGTNNSVLGYYAGYYETGSYKIIIDNRDRTSEALQRTNALIYGVTDATRTSQILQLGGGGKVGVGIIDPDSLMDIYGGLQVKTDLLCGGGWRTWSPTLTWSATTAAPTTVARYNIVNNRVEFYITLIGTNNSGGTLTTLNITLPYTPKDVNAYPPTDATINASAHGIPQARIVAGIDALDNADGNRKLYTWLSIANAADYTVSFEGFYEITGQ